MDIKVPNLADDIKKNYISEHFSVEEFSCHCFCGQNIIVPKLVKMAEDFRKFLCEIYHKDMPMDVHCVNRCPDHNEALSIDLCRACGNVMRGKYTYQCPQCGSRSMIHQGAIENSEHVKGEAMDFHCPDLSIESLHKAAESRHTPTGILWGGLGMYSWGCHIDVGNFRSW